MANNTATLNGYLDTALLDTTDAVWASAEKDLVIAWAIAGLWPRISRELPVTGVSATEVTLVTETYFYNVPTGALAVDRIEWMDSDDNELGSLPLGSWNIVGDVLAGAGQLHIAPTIVEQGGTLRCYCRGRYDSTTNLIPDEYVPIVITAARAELLRRMVGDRARFEAWLARQQTMNITVNEAMQMVREAQTEADDQRMRFRTWTRPVPARF